MVIFFKKQGLTIIQIGLIISFYSLIVASFTMISGILSDKYGRKQFLVLGELSKSVGLVFLAISNDIIFFTLGQFFCGLGFALVAGTDSAFLYENYVILNKEHEYRKAESKSHSILFFSVLFAGIIGAIVSEYNIRIPFILTIPFNLIAAIIAFTFTNIPIKNKSKTPINFTSSISKIKIEFAVIYYIVLYAIIRAIIMATFIGLVPFYLFESLKIDITLFGFLFAIYMLTGYFFGNYENKIENLVGRNKFSYIICCSVIISLILLGSVKSKFGAIIPAILYFVAGSIRPFAIGNINELLRDKSIRSTILSFAELIFAVCNVIFTIVSFYIYAKFSLSLAFYVLLVMFLILYTCLVIYRFYIIYCTKQVAINKYEDQ